MAPRKYGHYCKADSEAENKFTDKIPGPAGPTAEEVDR